jgi:hypothetical protein
MSPLSSRLLSDLGDQAEPTLPGCPLQCLMWPRGGDWPSILRSVVAAATDPELSNFAAFVTFNLFRMLVISVPDCHALALRCAIVDCGAPPRGDAARRPWLAALVNRGSLAATRRP